MSIEEDHDDGGLTEMIKEGSEDVFGQLEYEGFHG